VLGFLAARFTKASSSRRYEAGGNGGYPALQSRGGETSGGV
jgi:hypothetical protein